MLAVNKNNKYSPLFCLLGIVCFLFTAGLAHATTYYSPYGSNQTHSVITTPGSHNFHIEDIFPDERWTKWYVNGMYTGTDEDDHTWWANLYADAEYTYLFSLDGTIEIKGLVYEVDLWGTWILQEYHTWNVTVDTISPTRPGTPYMDSGSDSGKSNSDAITNIDKPTFRWNASSDSGTGVQGYCVSYTNPVPGPEDYWTVTNSWTPNLDDPAIPEGTHTLYVRAKDYGGSAGNYSSVSSFQFTIDKTAPSPPVLLTPANNSNTTDTTPTLDWSNVSGVWKYHVYVSDHGLWFPETRDRATTTSTWDVTPALGYKDWWWSVNATDIAGNMGSSSGQWKFTVVAWPERQKLLASDGAAGDWFGYSVSISGDYAIVGANGDDDKGDNSGSAYIFRRDGTGWVQQQKLTASDGAAGDWFGYSVSISGDYAIVGAYCDDDKGDNSGSAYIFRQDGTGWVQQQKLTASDGAADDRFGYSVSISGDYAIIGANGDNDRGSFSGSAYIFRRDGTSWSQQQKLLASDGAAEDHFGISVSISGDYAIVGANGDDDRGDRSGSAYIFRWNVTSWSQQQKLTASDGADIDWFGCSVYVSGDYAIVGANGDDDKGDRSGSAYIFKWDGTAWVQQQKLTASDGADIDYFGCSVSINGDYAIVGAWLDDDKGDNSGSAYIFRQDGTGWVQQQKLTASDGTAGDYFGCSVSINGNKTIVGASFDDDKGNASGSAYIFEKFLTADVNGDSCVNVADFAVIGNQWLQAPGVPSADIAPEGGDGVVNFLDLNVLVNEWLQCGE